MADEYNRGFWVAEVKRGDIRLRLGRFADINDAAEAYRKASKKLYGGFAHAD